MGINVFGNRAEPSDAEVERDVAELRQLLAGIEGPKEPHSAYWQNFVVKVHGRIEQQGGRRKRRSFASAWASVGAAAVVTVIIVATGVFTPPSPPPPTPLNPDPVAPRASAASLADTYTATDTRSLVLSREDVEMISAIVSDDDEDAIFEAMLDSDEN